MKEHHHLNRISFDMLKICLYWENSGYIYVMVKSKQFLHFSVYHWYAINNWFTFCSVEDKQGVEAVFLTRRLLYPNPGKSWAPQSSWIPKMFQNNKQTISSESVYIFSKG